MHSFVILTCFTHKYFSINYYLIITFFSLETMFLLLKFWKKTCFCFWFLSPINSYKYSVFIKMQFVREIRKYACCITHVGVCSSPCIKLYILCSCLYFYTIHIRFASLQYSALQYIFGPMIRILVPFHVHVFCLAFLVCNYFRFLFQSLWNLYNIGFS